MEENIRKLDEWYSNIEPFTEQTKLTFNEALILTEKMLDEKDIEKQKKLKEELFFGTIYKLYDNLKKTYFIYQNSSEIDIDDIISGSCEKWFKYCSEGKLLEATSYTDLFRYFFNGLNREIFKTKFPFYYYCKIAKDDLIKNCVKYVLYRKEFDNFSYIEFQKLFPELKMWQIYYIFENFYIEIEKLHLLDKEEKIAKRKLELILPYLLYCYINTSYNPLDQTSDICRQEADDDYVEIENAILRERVRTVFEETNNINLRRKHILADYVGFYDDEPETLEMIGKKYNLTCERIRALKWEATRFFRDKKHPESAYLRQLYEDYDFTR